MPGEEGTGSGAGGNGGAGVAGTSGAGIGGGAGTASTGAAGRGGTTGVAGTTAGTGGSPAGSAGTSGGAGTSGVAGRGGTTGGAGQAGTAGGAAGRGGSGGTLGMGGQGGTIGGGAGRGGTTGAAGRGGTTGAAGGAGRGGAAGTAAAGTSGMAGTTGTGGNISCLTNAVVGFATQNGSTTGGGSAAPMVVTTASALSSALSNASVPVIQLSGSVTGNFNIPSNKTLLGACGGTATIQGHIGIGARTNVIVRNLRIVGNNCTDSGGDCEAGEDALEIGNSSRVWIDHCDVSDGSDGNLDVTNGADLVTISYSKFWYRGRSGGHQFSNLVGNSDNSPGDAGKLRVTWHHNWWADRVVERQPRVRYGQNHLYNNLWTSSGNNYCIGVGVNANILAQNNVFIGVADPLETSGYSNGSSVAHAEGNVYTNTSGMTADLRGGSVFTPPYTVTLDPASGVEAHVRANAGPR